MQSRYAAGVDALGFRPPALNAGNGASGAMAGPVGRGMFARRALLGGAARAVGDGALAAVPVGFGGRFALGPGGAATTTAARPTTTTAAAGGGTPVVLVHGGWHGGWCWRRLAPLLRAAGHPVWAPTLSGLADRAHLMSPEIGLETHIRDVAGLLEFEDLRGVLLVGHSYGGMAVAGVAERAADRVAGLVFLDAFVPEDGQALFDLLPPARRAFYLDAAQARGDGWRVPPPAAAALGISDEAEATWLEARLTDHPLRSFQEPVRLGSERAAALPRTYVHCTEGPLVPSFAPFAAKFRDDPAWTVRDLATGHDAMVLEPAALCRILLDAIPAPRPGLGA